MSRGWPQTTHSFRPNVRWMPYPWQFHGWAAMPMGSEDFSFAVDVIAEAANNHFADPRTKRDDFRRDR
jgi:hypothetical protein